MSSAYFSASERLGCLLSSCKVATVTVLLKAQGLELCARVGQQLQALPSPPGQLPGVLPAPLAARDQRPAPVRTMISSALSVGKCKSSDSLCTCASAASSRGSRQLSSCNLTDSSRHCATVAWQALRASSLSKRTLPAWRTEWSKAGAGCCRLQKHCDSGRGT